VSRIELQSKTKFVLCNIRLRTTGCDEVLAECYALYTLAYMYRVIYLTYFTLCYLLIV